jgi:hypothetical protein
MKPNRLTEAIIEMADDMQRPGIMDAATHEKITLRHLAGQPVGAGTSASEPGGVCPVSQFDRGLCFAVGTRDETAERSDAGVTERYAAQRGWSDLVRLASALACAVVRLVVRDSRLAQQNHSTENKRLFRSEN